LNQHLPDDTHARTASDDAIDLKNVKEWATLANVNQREKNEAGARENINYPSLVIDKSLRHGPASKSFRYPWEAFFDVGFRCSRSLP